MSPNTSKGEGGGDGSHSRVRGINHNKLFDTISKFWWMVEKVQWEFVSTLLLIEKFVTPRYMKITTYW